MKKNTATEKEHNRERSEEDKTKIIWFFSGFCMLFVVGIWFFTLKNSYQSTSHEIKNISISSFPDIKEELSGINEISENFDSLKNELTNEQRKIGIEEIAKKYLLENIDNLSLENLALLRIEKIADNWNVAYQQSYQGILVDDNQMSLIINDTAEEVINFISTYDKNIEIDTIPKVQLDEAHKLITTELSLDQLEFENSTLVIYKNIIKNPLVYHLAWKINIISEPFYNRYYYIDAQNGDILYYYNLEK